MSLTQARLVEFLLSFYLKTRQEELDLVDKNLADLWRTRTSLAQDEFERGLLSLEQRSCKWNEINREMASWDGKLDDWREERWYLRKILAKAHQENRKIYAAT